MNKLIKAIVIAAIMVAGIMWLDHSMNAYHTLVSVENDTYDEHDFTSVAPHNLTDDIVRLEAEKDSLLGVLDTVSMRISEIEDSIAILTPSSFMAAGMSYRRSLSVYRAKKVHKVRVRFANDVAGGVSIPLTASPRLHADLVQKYLSEYLATQQSGSSASATVFSTKFGESNGIWSSDLFMHIAYMRLDPVNPLTLPEVYSELELTGDDRYDVRLRHKWYQDKLYATNMMDAGFDDALTILSSTWKLDNIIMNNSNMSSAELSHLADVILANGLVGRLCWWRNTNLPPSYYDRFVEAGWGNVRITSK